jgi:predicted Zn-dependent protease
MATSGNPSYLRRIRAEPINCGIAPATRRGSFISLTYDLQVTRNLEKAQQTCDLWVQAYPRAWLPHGLLSGGIYNTLGKYEKSVDEAKIAIGMDPDFSIGYSILAGSYLALGRTGES